MSVTRYWNGCGLIRSVYEMLPTGDKIAVIVLRAIRGGGRVRELRRVEVFACPYDMISENTSKHSNHMGIEVSKIARRGVHLVR